MNWRAANGVEWTAGMARDLALEELYNAGHVEVGDPEGMKFHLGRAQVYATLAVSLAADEAWTAGRRP